MDTKLQLRLNGYSVNDAGHIVCQREGGRYEQERTAIIQIDGGREIVDRLIAVADSPRALIGRSRDGAAVLLFRHDGEHTFTPSILDHHGNVFDLLLNSNHEPLRLAFGCDGLDPSAWVWAKGRSPADVPRDSLPNLTFDLSQDVAVEALKHAREARYIRAEIERTKAFEERRAKYVANLAKPKTAEQLQLEEDEKILEQYAGEVLAWDDPGKPKLDAARARRAQRQRKRSDAAA